MTAAMSSKKTKKSKSPKLVPDELLAQLEHHHHWVMILCSAF